MTRRDSDSPDEHAPVQVLLRMSRAKRRALKREAHAAGMTVNAYVNKAIDTSLPASYRLSRVTITSKAPAMAPGTSTRNRKE